MDPHPPWGAASHFCGDSGLMVGEVLACRNTSREILGAGLGADGGCQTE